MVPLASEPSPTAAHPHEALLRNAYASFARGDLPGFLALCTPDISFRVPGNGLLSGSHSRDAFLAKLGPAMQAVGGSFREEVQSILASEEQGAVVVAQQVQRDGKLHRWNCVHWWTIRGGRLSEFWEFVDDPAAFDAAWHA
jgi:ketosteroid isomerase-like protein